MPASDRNPANTCTGLETVLPDVGEQIVTVRFADAEQDPPPPDPTVTVTLDEKLPELSQPFTVILCVPALIEID